MFTVKFYKIKETTDELGYKCMNHMLTHFVECAHFERVAQANGGFIIITYPKPFDLDGVERHVCTGKDGAYDAYLAEDYAGRTIDRYKG